LFAEDLFLRYAGNWEEDQARYSEILADAKRRFLPVGLLEDVQVERIAVCELKRKRMFRFETAEIKHGHIVAMGRYESVLKDIEGFRTPPEKVLLKLLRDFLQKADAALEISVDLKNRIFEVFPQLEAAWPEIEAWAEVAACLADPERREFSKIHATQIVKQVIQFADVKAELARDQTFEVLMERASLPSAEALERIQRYQASLDREMTNALDTLERLQEQRKSQELRSVATLDLDAADCKSTARKKIAKSERREQKRRSV
jgi:hypothetical protein